MPVNCTEFVASCDFPYRYDNATCGCVSAADLLGNAFTAYELVYTWAVAILLFGFLRSWLFSFREHQWHLVGSPSVAIPLLCTVAQLLAQIEASNLHLLRWSTRIWASLGCDLFAPSVFSALLVYCEHARPRAHALGRLSRRMYKVPLHAIPWCLGFALSVVNATTLASIAEGLSYIYIVPFILVLAADMARIAWTVPDHRTLRQKLTGLCVLLVVMAVYLTARGGPLLLAQSLRQMPATFPFESMPVPVAKVAGSTLALLQYGRPRAQKSRCIDPLTLAAGSVALLSGLMATGFIVGTAEALEAVFMTAVTAVPALFIAALCAQLLCTGSLLERSEDDTAALIVQCKDDLRHAWSIPVALKQFCSGSFLVSLSLKMGSARLNSGGSSAATYGFQVLGTLVEFESLAEWTQDHRLELAVTVLVAYVTAFGSFVLLRLAPMPRNFLVATIVSWRLLYDLLLISAMRYLMKGLECDEGKLLMNPIVQCDLGYAHREAILVGFFGQASPHPHAHARTRAHTHARTHAHAHTRAHARAHTPVTRTGMSPVLRHVCGCMRLYPIHCAEMGRCESAGFGLSVLLQRCSCKPSHSTE
jgi:hypothetical protein